MKEKQWTRQGARVRMGKNKLLKRIMRDNSIIRNIIAEANQQKNKPGYHRIRTYLRLRDDASNQVGWDATKCWSTPEDDYDAVIGTIDDLLPPDDVDLYPNGKPK